MVRISPAVDIRKTKTIRVRTDISWLPDHLRKGVTRITARFSPTKGEQRFLRKRKPEPPSVWAPKSRYITYGPLEGARWDNSFMPHMRGIMDGSFFPSVRMIGNIKAPQTGSSAGLETMLAYVADMQPGDAFVVYPDRETARNRSTDYLAPIFTKSPRLRKLLTGVADDVAGMRIRLMSMLIYMGYAGSVTSLGNKSARFLFGDEVDKWPEKPSKKEAGSYELFLERFRAYKYDGKCWLISTPTVPDGVISRFAEDEAEVVFDYHIPCPACGKFHKMEFSHIRLTEDTKDSVRIVREDLGSYVTPCCGLVLDDRVRIKALQKGVWHSPDGRELFTYLKAERPTKICFHSPAWVSPLVSLSEILAAWFKGLARRDLHYFDTQIAAKAHIASKRIRKEDAIVALEDSRKERQVPGENRVACLVASVDTQKADYRYVIRAIGWGFDQPSWLVRRGTAATENELKQILFETPYQDEDGLYYPVHKAVIDTGGNRTSEVYRLCRSDGRFMAYKGASGRKSSPITRSVQDKFPDNKTPIPGGLELYVCDTHYFKDQLADRLREDKDGPRAFRLHKNVGLDYAQEMCAEVVNENRLWINPKNLPNHNWDCECMVLVGCHQMQIQYWPVPVRE